MTNNRFHIVFKELAKEDAEAVEDLRDEQDTSSEELDEISELRRLSIELAKEDCTYNTST